jgi:aubergine-like protein
MAILYQLYNNILKDVLRVRNLDEVTRGKFFMKDVTRYDRVGLNVIRGFKMTLAALKEKSMLLQIDVCSKVFRASNLLEEINRLSKDAVESLKGETVITRYGKIKTYRIEKIDYTQTPKSTFYHESQAGKITYAQYYQDKYQLKVTQFNQPLIEVIARTEKRINKEGKLEKNEFRVFLIPEFVALTGMSDEQRKDYKTMQEIAPMTKLTPTERFDISTKLTDSINGHEFEVGRVKKLQGYQLNDPEVKLSSNSVVRAKDGALNFRDKVKESVEFKDWVIVYSLGKNAQYDDQDADDFVDLIHEASAAYKMKFGKPGFITCSSNIKSWKEEIERDVTKNGKPQIIVLFLNNYEEKFYAELKQFITCELKLPSQGVKRKTVSSKVDKRKTLSAASKLIIQMNQKIGGVAWETNRSDYFNKRSCMHGAFSISRGKRGFTLAFVGTSNNANTKIYNQCKVGYPNKENIPAADFNAIFLGWAKSYVDEHNEGPSMIMVYREGLSLQQVNVQVRQELQALENVIEKIAKKTKKPNYKPECLYIVVNTKINTRIFDTTDGYGSQGKFPPKVSNPSSGSVVFDELSQNKSYDFHLTAQKVTQGTCTPTHYTVVSCNSNVPQESLAQFTYEQCFNYPNWQGAVKVPAVLQCANKLAKLVGESIQRNVTEGDVTKSFYFL